MSPTSSIHLYRNSYVQIRPENQLLDLFALIGVFTGFLVADRGCKRSCLIFPHSVEKLYFLKLTWFDSKV